MTPVTTKSRVRKRIAVGKIAIFWVVAIMPVVEFGLRKLGRIFRLIPKPCEDCTAQKLSLAPGGGVKQRRGLH